MADRPLTLRIPATRLSDAEIDAEEKWLGVQWDASRDALEESGGMSGAPGEWMWERLGELETEAMRRAKGGGDG